MGAHSCILKPRIKKPRDMGWNGNGRQHDVNEIFSPSGLGKEIMMYDTVDMNLPKEHVVLDWVGDVTLNEWEVVLRVKDYQVQVVRS
jgi:hypothetical protein